MLNNFSNPLYKDMQPLFGLNIGGLGYALHEDAFTEELKEDIERKTQLEMGSLGDWWVFPTYMPRNVPGWKDIALVRPWSGLLKLALNILNCEATRLFVNNLYLDYIPAYTATDDFELKTVAVHGSKRTTAWYEPDESRRAGKPMFWMYGKDESCCIEGSWYDWCCFACNILASENTLQSCPALYEPKMKNDNY